MTGPLARNRHARAHAVARLARHPEAGIRALVATRPDLGPDLAAELMCARLHPFSRTWAEYDMLHRIIGHGPDCTCPITEPDPQPSPARPTARTC